MKVQRAASKSAKERQPILVGIALALITFAVYWPVLRHGFVSYDDQPYVTENVHVQAGLTKASVIWAWSTFHASNWHPVTWLSHILDCQMHGLKAGGHHFTSLLIHVANVVLLFAVLRRMTGAMWRSAVVAALFAWHPLHVESVAWVAERKDVLSTLFWLLTMAAYASYVESQRRRPGAKLQIQGRYILALLFFALGLLSKPMVVTLPLVLLLLDYWPLHRITFSAARNAQGKEGSETRGPPAGLTWRELVMEKTPFLVLTVLSCIVTLVAQRAGGACSLNRGCSTRSSPDQRRGVLRSLRGEDILAAEAGGFLSAAHGVAVGIGGGCGRISGGGVHRGDSREAAPALSVRGMVLVRGNVGACHRVGPGRIASHGQTATLMCRRSGCLSSPHGAGPNWRRNGVRANGRRLLWRAQRP